MRIIEGNTREERLREKVRRWYWGTVLVVLFSISITCAIVGLMTIYYFARVYYGSC